MKYSCLKELLPSKYLQIKILKHLHWIYIRCDITKLKNITKKYMV